MRDFPPRQVLSFGMPSLGETGSLGEQGGHSSLRVAARERIKGSSRGKKLSPPLISDIFMSPLPGSMSLGWTDIGAQQLGEAGVGLCVQVASGFERGTQVFISSHHPPRQGKAGLISSVFFFPL